MNREVSVALPFNFNNITIIVASKPKDFAFSFRYKLSDVKPC